MRLIVRLTSGPAGLALVGLFAAAGLGLLNRAAHPIDAGGRVLFAALGAGACALAVGLAGRRSASADGGARESTRG